jgi:hypothetical protein
MQQANPIEQFVEDRKKRSAYQIMGNAIRAMLEALDVEVWSRDREANIESPADRRLYISPRHYITLVQKLTSFFHHAFIKDYFQLPGDYNFTTDTENTKARRVQKDLAEIYSRVEADGNTYAYHYLASNLANFVKAASIVAANTEEGKIGEFKIAVSKDANGTPKFAIEDHSAGNVPGSVGKITDQDYPKEFLKVKTKANSGWIEGVGGAYKPNLYDVQTTLPSDAAQKRRRVRAEATDAWLAKHRRKR